MKKIFLIFIFLFSLAFASKYPEKFSEGSNISETEFLNLIDFCFVGQVGIIENTYSVEPSLNYKLYYNDNMGEFTIGFAEFYLYCRMYHLLGTKSNDNSSIPDLEHNNKRAKVYKRSPLDRCQGMDNFDGNWNFYGCDGSTGSWYVVKDANPGTFDAKTSTYSCIDWEEYNKTGSWRTYQGSSYLNMFIGKYKFEGTVTDAGYIWQSYACAKGGEETNHYQGTVKLLAPARTCVGNDCNGSTYNGGSNGSGSNGNGENNGGNVSELTPKLEEIKSELTEIKNENSDIKSEVLGKVSDVKSELLLQNQQIAINQDDLLQKIDNLEAKNLALQNELDTKFKENIETQTSELKSKINETELSLRDEIQKNNSEIKDLKDLVDKYNIDNVEGRNDILSRLGNLENGMNGLGAKIDNLANGNGNGSENGNGVGNGEVLDALNNGLGKIDDTLNKGLIDETDKPYLKSIDEILKGQSNNPDDVSELNSMVGSELGFVFSNYSNIFNSGFCSAPSDINVSLMGRTYTLVDFSVLNNYVGLIRGIFISLASLLGLLIFLRGSR
ncbi:hypothetical protein PJV99_06515 [Aliarcobacter butzleri]|uniref:hypothetical protein n=1 Tax=Aliarcobacter butzleri TaxID=28197 RepID=UPI00263E6682|nr:hypothetical protein [Aliarcobacter butzleri]MDN5109783.1 hypothetical protein [Aliarcobacter butzleri]